MKPTADSIAASLRAATGRGLPPVHKWNPPQTREMDLRIRRDGTWVHEGTIMSRAELVRLFSTILKREGDAYFLVTPIEKVKITVDDVPFIAVDFESSGDGTDQTLTFLTNVGDRVTADADHPIRVETDPETGEPAPYVEVRAGLEALIDRKSFYRMVDMAEVVETGAGATLTIHSGGVAFDLGRAG